MAQRFPDPFAEPGLNLASNHNPYVHLLRSSFESGTLPVRFGGALRDVAGKWHASFSDSFVPKELVLEVGCHLGKNLVEFAADYPETGFIGADITFKRVCKTAMRAREQKLQNVNAILFNGKHIDAIFAPGELDGAVIFFPDPWVKERRAKHRLINEEFSNKLFSVVKPGGFVWFKTDQEPYFQEASHSFAAAGFQVSERTTLTKSAYQSTFERRFTLEGLPTYEVFLRRSASSN